MGGRITKAFIRFIAPVLIVAVMGNSSLTVGAGEINNIDFDTVDAVVSDGEEISDTANSEGDDSDSLGMDVCFFIRTDREEATIPNEPMNHPTFLYSSAIRINEAVSDGDFVYANSITEEITADGFTAQNAVTDKLSTYPSVSQIQEVYSDFDPNTQYVLWYVIKRATTPYPNNDVFIHVDGMILDRPQQEEVIPGEENGDAEAPAPGEGNKSEEEIAPGEGNRPEEETVPGEGNKSEEETVPGEGNKSEEEIAPVEENIPKVSEELSFEVFSTNTQPQFEYDGEEHLIGGYVIRVTDNSEGNVSEYVYGPYGDFLSVTVKAVGLTDGITVDGTVFTHKGIDYNVNVDSAFLLVRNPGTYEIPLIFKGIIMSAADIIIKDEAGKIVDTAKLNVSTPSSSENVTKRKLTIEAGSTIQNDNGTTLTNDNVKITSGSLLEGHRLVTSIVGSQTGPGESVNEITSYDIVDADGKSYKDMYDVTSNKGWLVVIGHGSGAGGEQSVSGADSYVSGDGQSTSEAGTTNSAGRVQTSKYYPDGRSVVIYRDQSVLGATRDDDGQSGVLEGNKGDPGNLLDSDGAGKSAVLGARMSPTTDLTMPLELRIFFIVLCLMALMVINIKRNRKL